MIESVRAKTKMRVGGHSNGESVGADVDVDVDVGTDVNVDAGADDSANIGAWYRQPKDDRSQHHFRKFKELQCARVARASWSVVKIVPEHSVTRLGAALMI